jgi:hypothetical protein
MPSAVGPAPLPLPDVERAPLERDSVDAWTGPVPEIQPGEITSLLAEKNIYKVKKPLDQVERVSLLSNGKIPPQIPPAPVIEPPPTEPADTAEDSAAQSDSTFAPANGPVPAPRLASIDPSAVSATTVEVQGVPKVIPKPRPAHLTRSAPKIELEPSTAPAASPVEVQTAIRAETPAVAQPLDLPTKFASLSSPYPVKRPANFALPRTLPSVAKLPAITGTTNRSIREAATEQGLPLDRTALIGILNLDTGRKALLRLPDGRYQSMIVGDVLDGWRVSLIGVDAMRFSRAGEDRTLLLVNR